MSDDVPRVTLSSEDRLREQMSMEADMLEGDFSSRLPDIAKLLRSAADHLVASRATVARMEKDLAEERQESGRLFDEVEELKQGRSKYGDKLAAYIYPLWRDVYLGEIDPARIEATLRLVLQALCPTDDRQVDFGDLVADEG